MHYSFFKKAAFSISPELAHDLTIKTLHHFPKTSFNFAKLLAVHKHKIEDDRFCLKTNMGPWSFPIGLAAGLDKNAQCIDFFTSLPFGAVEVGTLTLKPQSGNPKPRLFRLEKEESLLNRMGFNNNGGEFALNFIKSSNRHQKKIGANIGKNKNTKSEDAPNDYKELYKLLASSVDYVVINVSSPNTPGLRIFEKSEGLTKILKALDEERAKISKPLYIKISPDMEHGEIENLVALASEFKLSGIIATNTTIIKEIGEGGVSGNLLALKSKQMRKAILQVMKNDPLLELIAVGGIASVDDLWELWKQGGSVAQIYTSLIYQGPKIIFDFVNQLDFLIQTFHFRNLQELVDNIESLPESVPPLPRI